MKIFINACSWRVISQRLLVCVSEWVKWTTRDRCTRSLSHTVAPLTEIYTRSSYNTFTMLWRCNRGQALLQHDNAPAHTSRIVKRKIEELPGIKVLSHPDYSPDIAPSDYDIFRSMSHFLRGSRFASETEVATALTELVASKTPQWNQRGIECLAQRLFKVVKSEE